MSKTTEERLAELETLERQRIIERHNLPAEIAERLRGESIDELEADAARLSQALNPTTAPPTENGAQPAAVGSTSQNAKDHAYSFNVPGGVEW